MKKLLLTTILTVVAVLTHASSIPDFPFVFATGQAEKEAPPDRAKMTFQIKAFHELSSNAVAKVTSRSVDVINFLAKQGFSKGSLVTFEMSKHEVRERKEERELKVLGYEATRRFELTFDDLSKYDLVARTLFKTDDVTDISTEFKRKDQKDIETSLLSQACADAKNSAAAMASGFGKAIGEVFCISKQGFGNIGVIFGLGADAFDSRGGMAYCMATPDEDAFLFIPATIRFQNQVSVMFTLVDKK
jgi:uncharacterized protein YggE